MTVEVELVFYLILLKTKTIYVVDKINNKCHNIY